ncbi:unnamed protein product [Larinioides sclopetarius]|uniref:Secreted protein n=1 Tax=Larinioides sclopetarius TaxID=280406 RepID=A0AAV2A3T9_9ARAC
MIKAIGCLSFIACHLVNKAAFDDRVSASSCKIYFKTPCEPYTLHCDQIFWNLKIQSLLSAAIFQAFNEKMFIYSSATFV